MYIVHEGGQTGPEAKGSALSLPLISPVATRSHESLLPATGSHLQDGFMGAWHVLTCRMPATGKEGILVISI